MGYLGNSRLLKILCFPLNLSSNSKTVIVIAILSIVNGIKAIINDDKFLQLLNLDSGRSVAFVIDDTGSMGDEIEAVINTAAALVQQFGQSCRTSIQCIVSPFNDPGKDSFVQILRCLAVPSFCRTSMQLTAFLKCSKLYCDIATQSMLRNATQS